MMNEKLVFLKLGGAAITDKSNPRTPQKENITQLANQVARALRENPGMQILIGHGSGSFGHFSGQKNGTRDGVRNPAEWLGFAEVWKDARLLNELVIHSFQSAGLPVIAFPPSAWLTTNNRKSASKQTTPILCALENGLIPIVNGDVIFDSAIGGTILSTEEVFSILVDDLYPARIILASREPGVWEDYPANTRLVSQITPNGWEYSSENMRGSADIDVTGGMAKKVSLMVKILHRHPDIKISILSGIESDTVFEALLNKNSGTLLHSD
jgi:isopentenyl phosphate kinase